ncbi:MAG TPA: CoB--CoM heterodisulfide reductase iron-sulfur subunit A family protein [Anaerolineales bacterium]|nr:CoB--CoM heterodisulfide reductase iron-sulfur subunit A family protein [Anaerolineales bacterium]
MSERVGVYVCHCGTNIAGMVDVAGVAKWAQENLPGVVVGREYKFMCSSLGQELIQEDIRKEGLTRVVVAACSPHLHERTFRTACANAGLNPYLCQMASLREQVSWVTRDKEQADAKARALIAGAVRRVQLQEPLEPTEVPVNPTTLVVGAGIAGIQASLEMAEAGHQVVLVEREPSIGGHMAQFDKTFPTLDCSACILTPKMSDVGLHPNIRLLSYSEVENVSGYVGNFDVRVRKKARSVREDACTGCGICIEKCPKKVIDDVFEVGIGYRKAIYRPFPQAVPKFPVIDRESCIYFERGTCKACEKFCPTNAVDFEQVDEYLDLTVGNIILATGYDLFDCGQLPQYGYGRLTNVFTSLEFERMCNAAGPTEGKIVLRDGVTTPKTVALIHCVGSRDKRHHPYCSAVCCMSALKFGHLVMEKTGAEVYSFYIDMRPLHKNYEEFYDRLQQEGMHFVRGRAAEVTDVARRPEEDGKLIIQAEDTLIGKQRRVPVDMVILLGALQPRADAKEIALRFGISTSIDGWFTERHPKLDPVATMTEGLFIAGTCQGPKDIPDSVAQGAAAAARVQGMITTGTVLIEPIVAEIDEARCSGCRICNNLCPFNAIDYLEDETVSRINAALCKGCGTCVAACPAQAIGGKHFTYEQISAEIEGVLYDVVRTNGGHALERVDLLEPAGGVR